jgi:hypothetical protein
MHPLDIDVRLLDIGGYISGKENPMAVSWVLCVAVSWRPAHVTLAVIYIYTNVNAELHKLCVYWPLLEAGRQAGHAKGEQLLEPRLSLHA